ncbi:hypothetical protein PMAYCL1PPCAC_05249, partial [Pristionchus mayeri]
STLRTILLEQMLALGCLGHCLLRNRLEVSNGGELIMSIRYLHIRVLLGCRITFFLALCRLLRGLGHVRVTAASTACCVRFRGRKRTWSSDPYP